MEGDQENIQKSDQNVSQSLQIPESSIIQNDHLRKSLPELPEKVQPILNTLASPLKNDKSESVESENENPFEDKPAPLHASSEDLVKHIPTDIALSIPDETTAKTLVQIASPSIKPILNFDSVF